jgi:hypothetical protein
MTNYSYKPKKCPGHRAYAQPVGKRYLELGPAKYLHFCSLCGCRLVLRKRKWVLAPKEGNNRPKAKAYKHPKIGGKGE